MTAIIACDNQHEACLRWCLDDCIRLVLGILR